MAASLDKPKILVVDDSPESLLAMEHVLTDLEITIVKAGSGNEALTKMLDDVFALVLLDVQMPEMDGIEVASRIRNRTATRDTPIIFVAAVDSNEQHQFRGYEAGAVDFLHKPINASILRSKVNVFLRLYHQRQELEREIAERKRMDKDLQRSEAKFRALYDSTSDAVMLLNEEGFFDCNDATVRIFGCADKAEFSSKHPAELSPAEQPCGTVSMTLANQRITTAMKNGSHRFEWMHMRLDTGEEFPAEVLLNAMELDGQPVLQAVVRDITQRKRAEQALRESKERFERVATAVSDLIYEWDVATDRLLWLGDINAALGHPQGTIPPTIDGWLALIHPSDRDKIAESVEHHRKSIEPISVTYRIRHKDGEWRHWEARGSAVLDDTGCPISVTGACSDVTDRKRAEEELKNYAAALELANKALEESSEEAEAANKAKSEFLANMSHEIRTPMTAILGFADVLLENVEREEDISAANMIKRNGQYLLRLINDVLDLSKIEAGKLEVERITCSPSKVVADVASLMHVRAEAKGLPLEIEYVGGSPETILCDPTRLRQILINLLGNAIKFTETGSVRLVSRLVKDTVKPPYLQFDVIDSGIGMTQEQASKLFQPFTQADASTSRKFGGTGLGLTISKRLAKMLGGDITIRSRLGEGSTFSVTVETGPLDNVPILENVKETLAGSGPKAEAPAAPAVKLDCRILLAEDGPDNQRLISFILMKAGAEVTLAENGRIACDKALAARDAGEPFDIVLMDMQMPVMDGYAATRKLRSANYTGAVVALTANAMTGDDEKCRAAGCDGYASKPIDRAKLFETIAQFLVLCQS